MIIIYILFIMLYVINIYIAVNKKAEKGKFAWFVVGFMTMVPIQSILNLLNIWIYPN
jgi:hypothetical protein